MLRYVHSRPLTNVLMKHKNARYYIPAHLNALSLVSPTIVAVVCMLYIMFVFFFSSLITRTTTTHAQITELQCVRVSETNETLVMWSAEYSSDVTRELLLYNQKSFLTNLIEMRDELTNTRRPLLYHIKEAPSSRCVFM